MTDWYERMRANCTCPHGVRPLGRLYGVNMGRGEVRLTTAPGCPEHDDHRPANPPTDKDRPSE